MTKVEHALEALRQALREEVIEHVEQELLGGAVPTQRASAPPKKKKAPAAVATTRTPESKNNNDATKVLAYVAQRPGQRAADIRRACGIETKERWEAVRSLLERRGNTKSARYYPKS